MNHLICKPAVSRRGFTIVELLIIIVVIAIIAAITVVAYSSIQSRARDDRRVSAMSQLKTQLELYYTDNGNYPTCGGNISCTSTGYQGDISTLVTPATPPDPNNVNGSWGYYYARGYKKTGTNTFSYTNSDQDYVIGTRLESGSGPIYNGWNNTLLNFLDGK